MWSPTGVGLPVSCCSRIRSGLGLKFCKTGLNRDSKNQSSHTSSAQRLTDCQLSTKQGRSSALKPAKVTLFTMILYNSKKALAI